MIAAKNGTVDCFFNENKNSFINYEPRAQSVHIYQSIHNKKQHNINIYNTQDYSKQHSQILLKPHMENAKVEKISYHILGYIERNSTKQINMIYFCDFAQECCSGANCNKVDEEV